MQTFYSIIGFTLGSVLVLYVPITFDFSGIISIVLFYFVFILHSYLRKRKLENYLNKNMYHYIWRHLWTLSYYIHYAKSRTAWSNWSWPLVVAFCCRIIFINKFIVILHLKESFILLKWLLLSKIYFNKYIIVLLFLL